MLDHLTVPVMNGFIEWLECAPKTKKNYLGVVSRLLDQAVKDEVISKNPAKFATLPDIKKMIIHRQLDSTDLEIIFSNAGSWTLFYLFLYHTGLRAGDVAMLKYGDIDRKKGAITSFVRKSRRTHEFPLSRSLLQHVDVGHSKDDPIFPSLYPKYEGDLKNTLTKPRLYMQMLLKNADPPRPHATLHSFRVTFNNTLRDLGLDIIDRKVLMAHSASETTRIYTHPNFDLAADYVNRIPDYTKRVPKRDQM